MKLQEQISRIKSMMGVINEDKVTDYIHKKFDEIFNNLELVKTEDDIHQYNWLDKDGKKIFERNHWGVFWVYGCEEFRSLYIVPRAMGLTRDMFKKELLDYLNNRYFKEFGNEKPLKEIGNETCEEDWNDLF